MTFINIIKDDVEFFTLRISMFVIIVLIRTMEFLTVSASLKSKRPTQTK